MASGIYLHTLKVSAVTEYFVQAAHTGYIKSVMVQREHLWTILNIVAAGVVVKQALDQTQNGHSMNGECDLQTLDHFCYLGDTIGDGGGCESSFIARVIFLGKVS